MRTQDIKIGEYYKHVNYPNSGYAKVLKILRPIPEFRKKYNYYLTEEEKNVKQVVVKCMWMIGKDDKFYMIKYFRPCNLIMEITKWINKYYI